MQEQGGAVRHQVRATADLCGRPFAAEGFPVLKAEGTWFCFLGCACSFTGQRRWAGGSELCRIFLREASFASKSFSPGGECEFAVRLESFLSAGMWGS